MKTSSYFELLNVVDYLIKESSAEKKGEYFSPYKYLILQFLYGKSEVHTAELDSFFGEFLSKFDCPLVVDDTLIKLNSEGYVFYDRDGKKVKITTLGTTYIFDKQKDISTCNFDDDLKMIVESIIKFIILHTKKYSKEDINNSILTEMLVDFIKRYTVESIDVRNINSKHELIALFLVWAKNNDIKAYDNICKIAISGSILKIWDTPSDIIENLLNTKFYLDTDFLFDLSGCNGDDARELSLAILNFIKSKKGELYIFDRTKLEIDYIINSAKKYYRSSKFDTEKASKIAYFFRKNCDTKFKDHKFVELWHINFEKIIFSEFKIKIDRNSYYDNVKNDYQIDQLKLETELKLRRDCSLEEENFSIDVDVKNIDAIYKIRKDNGSKFFNKWSDVPAVFISNSRSLYGACLYIKLSERNHRIPAILNAKKMLFLIFGTKNKKFHSNMKLEILKYAHGLIYKDISEIQKIILEKTATLPDDYPENVVLEHLINKLQNLLIISSACKDGILNSEVDEHLDPVKVMANYLESEKKIHQERNQYIQDNSELAKVIENKEKELDSQSKCIEHANNQITEIEAEIIQSNTEKESLKHQNTIFKNEISESKSKIKRKHLHIYTLEIIIIFAIFPFLNAFFCEESNLVRILLVNFFKSRHLPLESVNLTISILLGITLIVMYIIRVLATKFNFFNWFLELTNLNRHRK